MRSAPPSLRSYSFIIFAFCLLFLIFGYRSLRSKDDENNAEDFDGDMEESAESEDQSLATILQAKCSEKKLERIGEYGICSAKNLNRERSCLMFSISTNSDLKFETGLSERMDKCKMRVYDHEAKASDSDGKYKVVEKMEVDQLTDKLVAKILGAEKKGKVHLLRLEAGADTANLAQSKVLKERQICHLLLTTSGMGDTELGIFARKMRQTYGYALYAINPLRGRGGEGERAAAEEEEGDEEEEEGATEMDGKKGEEGKAKGRGRKYALSFIGQHCQKGYEVKENK